MKRIICLILAMILCLAVFTGCEKIEGILGNLGINIGGNVTDEGVDKAHTFLSEMYKELSGTHVEDFDVVAQVVIGGVKYPVAWASDSDKVTIRESVKFGYYTVDLPDNNEEEFSFTLTATISSLSSKATKDKTFTIKVPAATAEDVLSIPAALELGKAQENNSYTTEKYYVTGKVTNITNETYGNLYIADEDGNEILVYGTYDATGKVRFDKMDPKPAVGDVVTFYSVVGNYNGAPQLKNGWLVTLNGEQLGSGDNGGNTPSTGDFALLDLMGNANLVSASGEQNVFAANGITFTNDKASSSSALTVQSSYAQRAYAGSTIKIEYPGMTKIVITFDDYSPDGKKTYMSGFDGMIVEGATFSRDNDVLTIIFAEATDVFQSTNLAGQVRIEKIEVYTGEVEAPPSGDNGGNETPTYTAPVADQAYDLYMELPTGKVYFAGSLDADKGTYLATTTDSAASVKIYFEIVDGGYHIYFMNGNEKTYINAAAYLKSNGYAGCHFELGSEPICVWTYDTTYGILEIYDEIEGKSDTFFAGTYGEYSTVSLSGAYYKSQIASGGQFPARIYAEGGEVTPPAHQHNYVDGSCSCGATDPNYQPPTGGEGGEGGEGNEGNEDGFMSISEVLASGEGTKVKFTGTVQSFYEDWSSYNNCSPYVVDEAGNKILVFRTTTHVYVGDVVTVEGTVTIYNTAPQIAKDGSVVTVTTAHTCSYSDATCTEGSACTSCGKAGSTAALGHTAANAEGECDRCGLNLSASYVDKELSFSDVGNRTSFTTSQQVWEANGIKLTNDKGSSTSNVADYSNPARFYKSSKITVEHASMTKIAFVCNSSSYATALQNSIAANSNYTVTVSGSTVTVTFADAVDSFVIDTLSGGQVRVNSLTVTTIG